MATNTRTITVRIGKEEFLVDTESESAIHDIDQDMDTVSARIAYYGELLAASAAEAIRCDAAYRNWRAGEAVRALTADPKVSEWKVRAEIEATENFKTYKAAEAACEYNQVALKNLIRALEEKSPNLRSKGARLRAELDSTDMNTKSAEQTARNVEELRRLNQERRSVDSKQPKKGK